jgi:hypothetical protein
MEKCQSCSSDRILQISAKCSDLCSSSFAKLGLEKDGYVPDFHFAEYGDYLCPSICVECGQVQGKFPITDNQVKKAWGE